MLFDVDPHRWQLSKTVKGDADDDIAKYDGLLQFLLFLMHNPISL